MANILLFNEWNLSDVKAGDKGLERYMNLEPVIVPRSYGRTHMAFKKSRVNIVERFMNRLMVPGHRGKRHKLTSGRCCGNMQTIYLAVKDAFGIIEKRTKKNPVQVLVEAIENSAILEEVASYRMGGIIARKAVIVSPQRRLDLALRYLTQGIYKAGFKNRKPLSAVVAEELIMASQSDPRNFAIREKNRIEREAEGAR